MMTAIYLIRRRDNDFNYNNSQSNGGLIMRLDLKIKMKLFVGFGIIMFTCALVALTALYAISKLDGNIVNLLETRIPQMKRIADINQAVFSSALHIEDAMIAPDH